MLLRSANDLVRAALGMIGEQLRLSSVEVTTELAEGEPRIFGHQVQVEQVLLNLLSNARDVFNAQDRAHKQISMRVRMDSATDTVRIDVEDNAGGIAPDVLVRIFEPFFTTKEVGKGTGLGLSISYGIIADMQGTLEAHNTDNGACFTITLPLCHLNGDT